jgi:DtxR family Mn-dependent transcriptional regulator
MIRNHRIWEVFLGRYLGYSWDEVHEEAEKLEHAGSEKMLRKLYELLDRPETCQHGNAIPTFTKPFTDKLYNSLNKYDIGDIVVVRQVKDDTELLKYLTKINLKLSDSIEIINKYDVLKQIEIKVHNQNIMMSDFTAKFIYVEKIF